MNQKKYLLNRVGCSVQNKRRKKYRRINNYSKPIRNIELNLNRPSKQNRISSNLPKQSDGLFEHSSFLGVIFWYVIILHLLTQLYTGGWLYTIGLHFTLNPQIVQTMSAWKIAVHRKWARLSIRFATSAPWFAIHLYCFHNIEVQ